MSVTAGNENEDGRVDSVQLRVQSLIYAGVAYAYGSRFPLPRHDDWDDDESGAAA